MYMFGLDIHIYAYVHIQRRMAEESTCRFCSNRVCADFKEEEEQSKKLAGLLDPMRTCIYRHEEVCVCVRVCVCASVRSCVHNMYIYVYIHLRMYMHA